MAGFLPGRLCGQISKIRIPGLSELFSPNLATQALPHNDRVTVRQCATEGPQVKNGAQALYSISRHTDISYSEVV